MKLILNTTIVFCLLLSSCSSLKTPIVNSSGEIKVYKYVYISPTSSLTAGSGATVGGQFISTSKTINPTDVITGTLTKQGFIKIPELKPELAEQTLIVNYGESGRRSRGFGYTIEVTIQFISAKTLSPISTCTAEGQGETEADDIRKAIDRCLTALFSK